MKKITLICGFIFAGSFLITSCEDSGTTPTKCDGTITFNNNNSGEDYTIVAPSGNTYYLDFGGSKSITVSASSCMTFTVYNNYNSANEVNMGTGEICPCDDPTRTYVVN